MKFRAVPLAAAGGEILAHNVRDEAGRRVLRKGIELGDPALARLAELGYTSVYVAEIEVGDVHENEAARRIAAVVAGPGTAAGRAHAGRVDLTPAALGVVRVRTAPLLRLNGIEGVTVATLPAHAVAAPRRRIATVKVIPYAIPEGAVARAEGIDPRGGIVSVVAIRPSTVALVLVGGPGGQRYLNDGIGPAIRRRLERLGARVLPPALAPPEASRLASVLAGQHGRGAEMIVVAGETAIMDLDDLIPRGLRLAGGEVEQLGLPMDPGQLLLLGRLGDLPVVGAPGCVRGTGPDGFDAVVPRLLAGEELTGTDLRALGHGGLLSDPRRG
ncbi:MAG: molybdopterin-binding protein [Gammaproteobacteria bacterium]|nr:molybdopterin-binding protein [Gammaproteobacteria bacterium]